MAAARLASRRALTTLLTRPSARTMASSAAAAAPRKFEFLVIVPDKPGTLEKRLEVRPYVLGSCASPTRWRPPPCLHDQCR